MFMELICYPELRRPWRVTPPMEQSEPLRSTASCLTWSPVRMESRLCQGRGMAEDRICMWMVACLGYCLVTPWPASLSSSIAARSPSILSRAGSTRGSCMRTSIGSAGTMTQTTSSSASPTISVVESGWWSGALWWSTSPVWSVADYRFELWQWKTFSQMLTWHGAWMPGISLRIGAALEPWWPSLLRVYWSVLGQAVTSLGLKRLLPTLWWPTTWSFFRRSSPWPSMGKSGRNISCLHKMWGLCWTWPGMLSWQPTSGHTAHHGDPVAAKKRL